MVVSRPLLEVENLTTRFHTAEGVVSAVDGISYTVDAGEVVGIVGESGSGKSVSVRSVLRLIEEPGRIEAGRVYWKGEDVLEMDNAQLRRIRGDEIAAVFQDPMEALDPAYTVGAQIVEAIRAHEDVPKAAARERAIGLLREVGIPNPEENVDAYPHEYSGGMAQRATIAIGLAGEPDLLVADEPTTGLDVTIQAQLIDLLRDLGERRGMAVVMITHDLGVVAELCERVIVMYAGRIAEQGPLDRVLNSPRHPYTRLFLDSVPRLDNPEALSPIGGSPPNLSDPPSGCRFRTRCPDAAPACARRRPPDVAFAPDHRAACYLHTEEYDGEPGETTVPQAPDEGRVLDRPARSADVSAADSGTADPIDRSDPGRTDGGPQ